MDYTKTMKLLEDATIFDLYRLYHAISYEMEDKDKVRQVKNNLRVGQTVVYYDGSINRLEEAEIFKLHKTRCVVRRVSDDSLWDILYAAINMDNQDISINRNQKYGLKKYEISIGETLTFLDRDNVQRFGIVKRINPKSVTLVIDGQQWRVGYGLLGKNVDIEGSIPNDKLILDVDGYK